MGPGGIDIYRPSLPAKKKQKRQAAESSRLALWTGACPFSSLRYRGFRRFVGPNFLVMEKLSRGYGVLGGFLCQGSSVRGSFFKGKFAYIYVRCVQSASKASEFLQHRECTGWTKELELTYWIFLIPLREGLGFFPYFS